MAARTTQFASRMRTRAPFRTFPAYSNTCAHFCQLGTQSVSPLFSAQPAPCMSRAPLAAQITRRAQATPFSALELSTGGPFGNILAACNAHLVVAFPSQPLARAGHGGVFRHCNVVCHSFTLHNDLWRLSRERERQRRQRRARNASWQQHSHSSGYPPRGCPPSADARLARMPADADARPVRMLAMIGFAGSGRPTRLVRKSTQEHSRLRARKQSERAFVATRE